MEQTDLLHRISTGDEAAFNARYQLYHPAYATFSSDMFIPIRWLTTFTRRCSSSYGTTGGNYVYLYIDLDTRPASGDIFDFYLDTNNSDGTGLLTGSFPQDGYDVMLEGPLLAGGFDVLLRGQTFGIQFFPADHRPLLATGCGGNIRHQYPFRNA